MTWKRTDLERLKAASITDRLRKQRPPDRYGREAALIGWQKALKLDEQAVAAVIAAREAAWNAGDTEAYAQLLAEDVDLVSATGRTARGREAVLKLYAEQHANAYAGVRTRTTMTQFRQLAKDAALADADYELEGGKVDAIRKGTLSFALRREAGRWRIVSIHSHPRGKA